MDLIIVILDKKKKKLIDFTDMIICLLKLLNWREMRGMQRIVIYLCKNIVTHTTDFQQKGEISCLKVVEYYVKEGKKFFFPKFKVCETSILLVYFHTLVFYVSILSEWL